MQTVHMTETKTIPAQWQIYLMFYIYALTMGSLYPRLADLQLKMHLGEAALGFSLLGLALGTQISLLFAASALKWLGTKKILLISIPLLGLSYVAASAVDHGWQFFLCLVGSGLTIGALEVVVNLEADRTEFKLGRRIMNRSHAFWSLGFFSAGIIGATASELKLNSSWHFAIITFVAALLGYLFFRNYQAATPRPNDTSTHQRMVAPSKPIVLICIFTLSAMLLEGAGADWSVIFMRDNFDLSPFINGSAFILGALSQAICRFFADALVNKIGAIKVSQLSIMTLGAGALLITFSPNPSIALLGFALAGAGTACIFPLAMSAAAQRTDRPAATNLASLAQISFVVFLLAPPLLGFIAEQYNIRLSFAVSLPLIIISWFTVSALVMPVAENDSTAEKTIC
ncbi:MAG: MFS transporter [Oceanospirillaceae bacterium]|nr:MFS transporter [Oceanospirillaceae bacterium]